MEVPAIKLADLSWQATKYHGQLHVHFLPAEVEYPACKRKRGIMDRQALDRVNAQGQDVITIMNFLPVSFCRGCLQTFRLSEEGVRSFLSAEGKIVCASLLFDQGGWPIGAVSRGSAP